MRLYKYPDEYKEKLLKRVDDGEMVADICREEGLNASTLSQWVRNRKIRRRQEFRKKELADHKRQIEGNQ